MTTESKTNHFVLHVGNLATSVPKMQTNSSLKKVSPMFAKVLPVSQSLRSNANTGIVPPYLTEKAKAQGNTGIVPPYIQEKIATPAVNGGIVPPWILQKIGHAGDTFEGKPANGNGGVVPPAQNGGIVPPNGNTGIVPPHRFPANGNTGIVPPAVLWN